MASVVHFDIPADDASRAIAFYERVFGWTISKAHGALEYWNVRADTPGQKGIGGRIVQRESEWSGIRILIAVPSVEAAAAAVESAGGKVIMARKVIPGVGYVTTCQDTEGNAFALFEESETAGF